MREWIHTRTHTHTYVCLYIMRNYNDDADGIISLVIFTMASLALTVVPVDGSPNCQEQQQRQQEANTRSS